MQRFTYYKTFIFCDTLFSRDCPSKFIHNTVDGLIFVGYQFLWFSWRVWSTNSSANEIAIFCMNYEGKYYGHEFWTLRMRDFCSIHENLPTKIKPSTVSYFRNYQNVQLQSIHSNILVRTQFSYLWWDISICLKILSPTRWPLGHSKQKLNSNKLESKFWYLTPYVSIIDKKTYITIWFFNFHSALKLSEILENWIIWIVVIRKRWPDRQLDGGISLYWLACSHAARNYWQ